MITNLTNEQYIVRLAESLDAEVIADQRTKLYSEIGKISNNDKQIFRTASQKAIQALIERNEYIGWLVEKNNIIVAGAGVLHRMLLPNSSNPTGCSEAYILNVYTMPEHRRQGLARLMMNNILDWCHTKNIDRITLHTSELARSLYEDLGFVPTAEMRFEGSLNSAELTRSV